MNTEEDLAKVLAALNALYNIHMQNRLKLKALKRESAALQALDAIKSVERLANKARRVDAQELLDKE